MMLIRVCSQCRFGAEFSENVLSSGIAINNKLALCYNTSSTLAPLYKIQQIYSLYDTSHSKEVNGRISGHHISSGSGRQP